MILLDYKTELRYQKFLSRLEFTSVTKYNHFRDCLHIGMAFSYEKKGDPRFENGQVNPKFIRHIGFTEEEIEVLFSRPKLTYKRKMTIRKNMRLYRQRKGAISYQERRRKNVEDFKKILQLKKKKFKRAQIADMLDMTQNRVKYLIQEYNRR